MEAIWQWGIDFIHTIQQVQGPALTAFFKAVTFLGEKEFFLLLLPLVFWCGLCSGYTIGSGLFALGIRQRGIQRHNRSPAPI